MVRKCLGVAGGEACQFARSGGPAQPKPGQARCSWCDPEALQRSCGSAGGLARLKQLLRGMPRDVLVLAMQRLPADIYADHFEAEFGSQDCADDLVLSAAEEDQLPAPEDADADLAALEQDDLAGLEPDLGDRIEDLLAASDRFDLEDFRAGPLLGIICTRG